MIIMRRRTIILIILIIIMIMIIIIVIILRVLAVMTSWHQVYQVNHKQLEQMAPLPIWLKHWEHCGSDRL